MTTYSENKMIIQKQMWSFLASCYVLYLLLYIAFLSFIMFW